MIFALSLLACSNDFNMVKTGGASGGVNAGENEDTGADVDTDVQDTDTEVDSGADTQTDEDPPDDTATDTSTDTATEEVPDDPPPADDCTDSDDLIYAFSRDDSTLYTFDPASLSFTSLGRVRCSTTYTASSMAVDRSGNAYIRYSDDSVFRVELSTLACSSTSYSDRSTRFDSFGMGYSTDSDDTWRDQMYVANEDTLGVLDTTSWTISSIGRMPSQSELTGNAAGELWAILPLESPAKIVQLDKTDGATLTTLPLRSFPSPSNIDTFAFATWGGDFYVFIGEHGFGRTTDVYKVTPSGTMTKELEDVGFNVVGAGVSTCAPS
jgi:hypothetical protein